VDPLTVRVLVEAMRVVVRAPHAEAVLAGEAPEQEAFGWQISRLAALQPAVEDYLQEAPAALCRALPRASEQDQRDLLLALTDLRAEASDAVLPLLGHPGFAHPELAVELLTWSRNPQAGPWLREWITSQVPVVRRSQGRRRSLPPRRPSVPAEVPYRAVLRAHRGHGSPEGEAFLLLAARDWDPTYRAAAVGSLGWWEPFSRAEVLLSLQDARRDPSPEVRQAARCALARLGQRLSLTWFRQNLASEDPQRVHETIQLIAVEGIFLLWPDLDRLADSEDTDIAHHAREALERLREEMGSPRA
jgi:hypothetical protein